MSATDDTRSSGLHFEDFLVGQTWTTRERLITQDDVDRFAALTGDENPVHIDAAFAARTPFRKRIAHGLLVESLASGLAWQLGIFRDTIVALREVSMRFEAPVVPGDILRLELEVLDRDATPGPRRGGVRLATRVRNQDGQLVLDGAWSTIVLRQPTAPRGSTSST